MSVGKLLPSSGITLIELLVTISVVTILATIALPNYTQLRKQQEVVASANDVLGAVQFARREAINRRLSTMVVLGDTKGWPILVKFTDPNTGNEVTALQRQSNYSSISIAWASGTSLDFNRFGRADTSRSLCISRDSEVSREVYIRVSGQIEVKKGGEIGICGG